MGGGGGLLSPITNALFGSPPSAPAAPNYTAAAQQTAQGNLDAARQATAANRVNQVTPYGNLNYSITGEDPYGNPTWTATQSLSPDQQQLYNMDIATSKGLGQLSSTGLDYVKNMMANPFSTSTLPSLQSSAGQPNMQQLSGQANLGLVGQGPDMYGVQGSQQAQGMGAGPQLQTGLQDQGMAGWDRASNLMMQRLQPQMDIQQKTLDAKLANQGLAAGTEAYNRAKASLGMQQNDLLTQAQLSAQGIGQNLFNQALQGGQFTNQALTQQNQNQLANTGLSNQAAQQNYTNLLAGQGFNNQAMQQQYANQLAAQSANNPALQQMYSNQQAQQQANNAIAQQQFGNQLANANLANAARQQGFGELSYQRNEPLNTLNAVRSGSQVQGAQFVNPAMQATTTGPDYLSASQAQGQYNLGTYNAQQAAQASANQGLMGLGGTLGAAAMLAPVGTFSDIRTKENIVKVGILENGLPVYLYEYKPEFKAEAGEGRFLGVMAHEVEEVKPEAVITRPDGYKMVDYAQL
jgi:hypothetical protein